jgi:transcriptional regulator with XRE-family HTH domain
VLQQDGSRPGSGFGGYLRTLRKDRRLSLESAEQLSRRFGEPLSSSYLSRLEGGKTSPRLAKLGALSLVYDVPLQAIVERYAWEQAGVRNGFVVDTPEKELALIRQLQRNGKHAEALDRLTGLRRQDVFGGPGDAAQAEDLALLEMNALSQLGYYELAKLEAERRLTCANSPRGERICWQTYVVCCYRLERHALAETALGSLDNAIEREGTLSRALADRNLIAGNLRYALGDPRMAVDHYADAVGRYESLGVPLESARARALLGSAWTELGKLGVAADCLQEAHARARSGNYGKVQAFAACRLARVASLGERWSLCERWALEANDLARTLRHRAIVFEATWYLLLVAQAAGDLPRMERYRRILRQWLPYADRRSLEVRAFAEREHA